MRLLVISDDVEFAKAIQTTLKAHHYYVDLADNKQQGSYWARTTDYDLIIIEHSPDIDAAETSRQLRQRHKLMPILAVVKQLSSHEAVALYNSGVDDYASKLCTQSELVARVKALLRRPRQFDSEVYRIDDLTLDARSFKVSRGRQSIYLTKKEFSLLEYLLRNKEQVLSRTDLIEHVWDINADLFSNSLETHILNLRKKIEFPRKPKLIHTISGRGYKIAINP